MVPRRYLRAAAIVLVALFFTGGGLTLVAGHLLTSPAKRGLGPPPSDLPIRPVAIQVAGGQTIRGWYTTTEGATATVVLLHPLRGSRASMVGRVRLLHQRGYDALAFDFRGHGESDGNRITLGPNEAEDVAAAVDFVRSNSPDHRIGVIGVSLGGAATLLNGPSLPIDALVAEAAFADLVTATKNRLGMRLGPAGPWLSPLLTWQIPVLLGFDPLEFSPERKARGIRYPVLLIYGTEDRRATPDEGRRLAAAIGTGARLWWIKGASHRDLYAFAERRYEEKLLEFFARHLC